MSTVRERAVRAQKKHAGLLKRASAGEGLLLIRNEIQGLLSSYTQEELRYFGLSYPLEFVSTVPDHAVVLAVRYDMKDSVDRIDLAISSRSPFWKNLEVGEASALATLVHTFGGKTAGKNPPPSAVPWWAWVLGTTAILGIGFVLTRRPRA